MTMFFALLAIAGVMALAYLPHHKDRTRRMLERGGAAAVFSLGLFGSVFSLLLG